MKQVIVLAWRHLVSNPLFTGINILGTSLSLLAYCLLVTHVLNEFSFDKSYKDYDRIYRVNVTYKRGDNEFHWPATPPALASHLHNAHQEITQVARLYQADFSHRLTFGEASYIETRIFYADSLFLEILDYPLVFGDRSTALDHPNSIVLTRTAARKYFGDDNALGKQLILNDNRTLTVTAILDDIPLTSHLDFNYVASFSTFQVPPGYTDDLTSWRWNSFVTYLKLTPAADVPALETSIRSIWVSNNAMTPGRDITIHLQKVSDIYLNSANYSHPYLNGNFRKGNTNALIGLMVAACVLLMIAVFNFTNLSMTTVIKRARNISVHKILGSGNGRLFSRFLAEAVMVQVISGLASIALLVLFHSSLSDLIGYPAVSMTPVGIQSIEVLIASMGIMALVSILYPIVVTGKMKVLKVLKDGLGVNRRGISTQQVLMIFQICMTSVLLSSTLIVKKQLQFISQKDLGYQSENVIVVRMLGEDMALHYDRLRNGMQELPNVDAVSRCKYGLDGKSGGSPLKQRFQPETEFKSVAVYESHHDFIRTTGIHLIVGRDFSPDFPTDSAEAIILNRAAVNSIGLTLENAIGTEVTFLDWRKKIVGVVEDFNYSSLHSVVGPLVMVMPFTHSTKFFMKIRPGDTRAQLKALEIEWNKLVPGIPFDYTFLESNIDLLYKNDVRFSRLIGLFTLIGIITASVGLIAVAWYNMTLRMKEIAIRKVLGASMHRIIILLARQSTLQTAIALAVSIPVTIYLASAWLSSFAYRIDSFLEAIFISIIILVLILVGILIYISGKLAILNPVSNLRND